MLIGDSFVHRKRTCESVADPEKTVEEEAFETEVEVQVLELLEIPRCRFWRWFILYRPTINGNIPRIKEPKPRPIIAPIFAINKIVEVVASSIFFFFPLLFNFKR